MSAGARAPRRILHAHSAFSLGGKEARAVRLMNAFGPAAHHTILSAMPGALGARDAIDPDVVVSFPDDAPSLAGRPGLARYLALADYMRRFDLVLTYNWGAMDAVMAHRLFRRTTGMPPLIHHEDGFNEDESRARKWQRNLFRRIALRTADALVVPSQTLARIATREWRAGDRLRVVANGIAVDRYAPSPAPDAIPGFVRREGEIVIGTLAGLRAVKNLPALVQAVAQLPGHVRLVIIGEGPDRAAIEAAARDAGIADRLVLPGFLAQPHLYVGHFDIFALSSLSEQAPISLIEAMAAGVPVASLDVGDVAAMVAPANLPFIARDDAAFRHALGRLAADPARRRSIGEANRRRAAERYQEAAMIAAYAALYGHSLGSDDALLATKTGAGA